jgi:hypothetical protein
MCPPTIDHLMEFDAENHIYYVDGDPKISVTQVLKEAGLIDTAWFTEFGRWRGSAVHKATHYFDEGDMDRRTLDPVVKPFVADWKLFREQTGFTPTMIEKQFYDEAYGFCGTPDRRGYFIGGKPEDSNELIDIKTYPGGKAPWWTRYQLAGYGRLLDRRRIFRRYAVVLTGHGANIEEYPSTDYVEDVNNFLACIAVARLKLANP